jgi:hypothetical protein
MTDIDEFLEQEIKGPAKFSCTTGAGCKFEEPAMNVLINDIFGDRYITLECSSGECLHYTQVPGYIVSRHCWSMIVQSRLTGSHNPGASQTRLHYLGRIILCGSCIYFLARCPWSVH